MRLGVVLGSVLSLWVYGSCSFVERFAFHTVDSTRSASLPPGVRLELALDGVREIPREGLPVRMYELRIAIEQANGGPEWRPSFDGATLQDDEGNVFRISAWYVDQGTTEPGVKRYRAVFELGRPYRFKSIMAVTAHWKLVSRGSPEFRISSRFKN